jgi:aminoglycoside phosphotransferase (APT) family kinase protein
LSDSLPEEVVTFLRRHKLVQADEVPAAQALSGGVSSDIWRVKDFVVKRALPRLRVAQVWEAPVERNGYERLWLETANAIVPGIAPRVLAGGDGCFAMEYLGELPVWKAELRAGRADAAFAAEVGRKLSTIHAATANDRKVAGMFATDASFEAIRLEPYLGATATVHPDVAVRLKAIAERTAKTRLALVHGDVSPKNILVGPRGPVFLDAECAWYGDPAFDLAFCLNHLLLKGVWVPERREDFLKCFESLFSGYRERINWEKADKLEERAATLLPGLLLARVDGKSPAEYLSAAADKDFVRRRARALLLYPPATLAEVTRAWRAS